MTGTLSELRLEWHCYDGDLAPGAFLVPETETEELVRVKANYAEVHNVEFVSLQDRISHRQSQYRRWFVQDVWLVRDKPEPEAA